MNARYTDTKTKAGKRTRKMPLSLRLASAVLLLITVGLLAWFALAPVTVLLLAAYFHYVEEKEARRNTRD